MSAPRKVTREMAGLMQQRREQGHTTRQIAAEFGICPRSVGRWTIPPENPRRKFTDHQRRALLMAYQGDGFLTVRRWHIEAGCSRFAARQLLNRLVRHGFVERFAFDEMGRDHQRILSQESGPKAVTCVVFGITRKGIAAARDLVKVAA